MTARTNFFEGMLVSTWDMTHSQLALTGEIINRQSDLFSYGVVSGLTVFTDSAHSYNLAVSPGTAYDPTGERLPVATLVQNISYNGVAANAIGATYTVVARYVQGNDGTAGLTPNGICNFRHLLDTYAIVLLKQGTDSLQSNDIRLSQVSVTAPGSTFIVNSAVRDVVAVKTNTAVQINNVSSPILAPNGSPTAPSYSFTNDTATGVYLPGIGQLGLAAGGNTVVTATTANFNVNEPIEEVTGSVSFPAYTFQADPASGMYLTAPGKLSLSASGVDTADITANGITFNVPVVFAGGSIDNAPLYLVNGTYPAPSYSFTNDPTTGMFMNPTGNLGLSADGATVMFATMSGATFWTPIIQGNPAATLIGSTGIQTDGGLVVYSYPIKNIGQSTTSVQQPIFSNWTLVGIGTQFTKQVGVGDTIYASNDNPSVFAIVVSVTDDTHLVMNKTIGGFGWNIGKGFGALTSLLLQKALSPTFNVFDAYGVPRVSLTPTGSTFSWLFSGGISVDKLSVQGAATLSGGATISSGLTTDTLTVSSTSTFNGSPTFNTSVSLPQGFNTGFLTGTQTTIPGLSYTTPTRSESLGTSLTGSSYSLAVINQGDGIGNLAYYHQVALLGSTGIDENVIDIRNNAGTAQLRLTGLGQWSLSGATYGDFILNRITGKSFIVPSDTPGTPSIKATGNSLVSAVQFQEANGTVGVPSHSFSSDTKTGVYLIGVSNFGVSVGGTQIGDWTPTGLTVTGAVQFTGPLLPGGQAGALNQVLTSSGPTAVPTWQSASAVSGAWSVNGNAATTPPTQFFGTTDSQPVVLKTNGTEVGRLLTTTQLGLTNGSVSAPSYTYTQDTKTGNYLVGTSNWSLAVGGFQVANGFVNGMYPIMPVNIVTAAGSYTVSTTTDYMVVIKKTSADTTVVTLPAPNTVPVGKTYIVKDGKGDAVKNIITIAPSNCTIDGGTNIMVNTNYGSFTCVYNGFEWSAL